jgi:predicted RND superfamily exporter protein
MFSHISERNIISMLGGTTLAVFLISAILAVALRSFRYGALSLIPNLVPAILGFGTWAIFVGSIGMSLSVVTGMTLGIVVDDSVHFLSKYLRARREKGFSPEDAIRYAFDTVGSALIATTIILVVGFGILSFSSFRLNNWMAQLTAIVIAFALIADLILLPALLLLVDRHKHASQSQTASDKSTAYETKPALA